MAHVVLLRGVNVGGHRVFRPAQLPSKLPDLRMVNIGAAGTFVVRQRLSQAALRGAIVRSLPFEAEVVICTEAHIRALVTADVFGSLKLGQEMVGFISVLGREPKKAPALPIQFPEGGDWLVKLIGRRDRFVIGVYRRHPRTIGYLGRVDRLFDVPVTTRNWNTFRAIAKVLDAPSGEDPRRRAPRRTSSMR
jgi:uncharacterized protein (DUF1697 family)